MAIRDTPNTLLAVIARGWRNWSRLQRRVLPVVLVVIWPVVTGVMLWSADIHKWIAFRRGAVDIRGTLHRSWYRQGGRYTGTTGPWGDISYTIDGVDYEKVMRIGVEDHRLALGGEIALRYAKQHHD